MARTTPAARPAAVRPATLRMAAPPIAQAHLDYYRRLAPLCSGAPRVTFVCKVGRWRDATWALARRARGAGCRYLQSDGAIVLELAKLGLLRKTGAWIRLTERGAETFNTSRAAECRRWPTPRDGHCCAAPLRTGRLAAC